MYYVLCLSDERFCVWARLSQSDEQNLLILEYHGLPILSANTPIQYIVVCLPISINNYNKITRTVKS